MLTQQRAAVQQARQWVVAHGHEPIAPPGESIVHPEVLQTHKQTHEQQQHEMEHKVAAARQLATSTPRISVFYGGLDNYTQFRIPALLIVPSTPYSPANGCVVGTCVHSVLQLLR